MSNSGTSDIEMLKIKQRNLSRNSNGHNFSHGCLIQTHNILRRSKLNNGTCREIQMVITFHSNLRFRRIIYWDGRNWAWKLMANSNGRNFWLGCPIQANNISRRLKLNNDSSREIEIVKTFHTEVRLRRIIYRDARNWTMEALEKFKWS